MGMATKNISLTEEAYKRLQNLKKEDESFSKTINRLTSKHQLREIFGILNDEEGEKLKETIEENRKVQQKLHEQKNKWLERKFSE